MVNIEEMVFRILTIKERVIARNFERLMRRYR